MLARFDLIHASSCTLLSPPSQSPLRSVAERAYIAHSLSLDLQLAPMGLKLPQQ